MKLGFYHMYIFLWKRQTEVLSFSLKIKAITCCLGPLQLVKGAMIIIIMLLTSTLGKMLKDSIDVVLEMCSYAKFVKFPIGSVLHNINCYNSITPHGKVM